MKPQLSVVGLRHSSSKCDLRRCLFCLQLVPYIHIRTHTILILPSICISSLLTGCLRRFLLQRSNILRLFDSRARFIIVDWSYQVWIRISVVVAALCHHMVGHILRHCLVAVQNIFSDETKAVLEGSLVHQDVHVCHFGSIFGHLRGPEICGLHELGHLLTVCGVTQEALLLPGEVRFQERVLILGAGLFF